MTHRRAGGSAGTRSCDFDEDASPLVPAFPGDSTRVAALTVSCVDVETKSVVEQT